jgi:hypothetical protein
LLESDMDKYVQVTPFSKTPEKVNVLNTSDGKSVRSFQLRMVDRSPQTLTRSYSARMCCHLPLCYISWWKLSFQKDGAPMLLTAISLLSPWRSTWPWTVPMRFSCCYARPESSRLCHLWHNAGKNLRPQPALVWTLWSKLFPRSGSPKMRQRSRGLAVHSFSA